MSKKIIEITVILLLIFNTVYSQAPSIEWRKCYGGSGSDICYCIQATSDGGSIACGHGGSVDGDESVTTHGPGEFWIVKLNTFGIISWEKSIGGNNDDFAFSIQQTFDGGYIVAGGTLSNNTGDVGSNHGGYDYWIVKLNNVGAIVWQKTYGGTNDDIAYSVQQTNGGDYIVAGESSSTDGDVTASHGNKDYWILKLDNLGNLIWQKSLGGSNVDFRPNSIKQTADGGYIVTGGTSSIDGDVTNPNAVFGIAWIVKLNTLGNIEWQKTYGSLNSGESGSGICQTSDGGYAATGICYANSGNVTGNHGNTDFWVIKLDASGNLIWQKSFGGIMQDEPRCIIYSDDGGLVITGWSNSSNGDVTVNNGGADFWVIKVSSSGSLVWQKTLGGSGTDQSYSVSQTSDHGFVVAGYSNSNNTGDVGSNHGPADYWIVKLASDVVPVTLSSFNAIAKSKDVVCEWETMQEQNSNYFIVQRSNDALSFIDTDRVKAKGNSALPLHYNFTDKNILKTNNDYLYYRLKMVDLDGSYKYSNIVKLKRTYVSTLSVYPNPAVEQLTVNFESARNNMAMISVFNDAGIKVYEQIIATMKGNNDIQINIRSLATGEYFVILNDNKQYYTRFIKSGK